MYIPAEVSNDLYKIDKILDNLDFNYNAQELGCCYFIKFSIVDFQL